MPEEFRRTSQNTAESTTGFTVRWIPHGGILYEDSSGTWRIDSELLVTPYRILVYEKSGSVQSMDSACRERLISRVKSALEYMGHQVELWNDGAPTESK
jgi:hypothetical protein